MHLVKQQEVAITVCTNNKKKKRFVKWLADLFHPSHTIIASVFKQTSVYILVAGIQQVLHSSTGAYKCLNIGAIYWTNGKVTSRKPTINLLNAYKKGKLSQETQGIKERISWMECQRTAGQHTQNHTHMGNVENTVYFTAIFFDCRSKPVSEGIP